MPRPIIFRLQDTLRRAGVAPFQAATRPFVQSDIFTTLWQQIVNHTNTRVDYLGSGVYTIEKTGGTDTIRDAGAVSSLGFDGDFVLRVRPVLTGLTFGWSAGMNSDPLTDDDYAGIDFSWFFTPSSVNWIIVESGAFVSSTLANDNYAWIWRTGTTLGYGRGATLAAAQAAADRTTTSSATLYFDSTFPNSGDRAEVLLYLPQDLVGTSSLIFAASATTTGTGALSGASALTFTPASTASGLGALSGASSLTFTPAVTLTGLAPITGSSSLTFGPSSTLTGKGALSGTSTLTFAPSSTLTGKGALSGASTLVFGPAGAITGSGALTGASTLTFAPTASLTGKGALSGASSLTFASSGTITGTGALSGSSLLSFSVSGTLAGSAPGILVGASSITFAAAGTLSGVAYIAGVASLNFEASGTLTAFDARAAMLRGRRRRRGAFSDYGIWRD